jgi:low affinity Fe/Cu permease
VSRTDLPPPLRFNRRSDLSVDSSVDGIEPQAEGAMKWMEHISEKTTRLAGSSWALFVAVLVTVTWLAVGPLFHFSQDWLLVYNTAASIVTFVMVFIIQRNQNKQTLALQMKLNELLGATHASNRLINIENLTEEEVLVLHGRYQQLANVVAKADDPRARLSVEHLSADRQADSAATGSM